MGAIAPGAVCPCAAAIVPPVGACAVCRVPVGACRALPVAGCPWCRGCPYRVPWARVAQIFSGNFRAVSRCRRGCPVGVAGWACRRAHTVAGDCQVLGAGVAGCRVTQTWPRLSTSLLMPSWQISIARRSSRAQNLGRKFDLAPSRRIRTVVRTKFWCRIVAPCLTCDVR